MALLTNAGLESVVVVFGESVSLPSSPVDVCGSSMLPPMIRKAGWCLKWSDCASCADHTSVREDIRVVVALILSTCSL